MLAAVVALFFGTTLVSRLDLSALPGPGRTETALATHAKRLLIGRAASHGLPPQPRLSTEGINEGKTRYGMECASCHGMDGRGLTDYGRWMYPRAADLTSPQVQTYTDAELFWIVRNGIRLSGMPAFGKVETDERIWRLVQYVRTLPTNKIR